MALEKSVLTEKSVAELLSRYYGITLASLHKLELGTANCFRVYDGTKFYFLKEFQSPFAENMVIQEAKLLEFLSAANIPSTNFYKTIQNEFIVYYQNHIICLEEYIEGQTYGYDDLPPHLLPLVGQMLGKLHQVLKNYLLLLICLMNG